MLALLLAVAAGCALSPPADQPNPAAGSVVIGFGLPISDTAEHGMRAAAGTMAIEGLAVLGTDGRPQPRLAEDWSTAPDGLSVRIRLRQSVRFHDGELVDARAAVDALRAGLPQFMGPAGSDIQSIVVEDEQNVVVHLRRRSTFVLEALETPVQKPKHPDVGTGPFRITAASADGVELVRNEGYYLGKPELGRVVFKPYPNLRATWADMMRGRIDMLFSVDPEATDLIRPARTVRLFESTQHYAYVILLNIRQPHWKDARIRQALNAAIDRPRLIDEAMLGHGVPLVSPVWPEHWAYNATRSTFKYDADSAVDALRMGDGAKTGKKGGREFRFSCLFPEQAVAERLVLGVQQQLRAFDVEMDPQLVSLQEFNERFTTGNFDAVLLPIRIAPSLLRTYLWWHSGGPYNFGAYRSAAVDDSLDTIRHADTDAVYQTGVAAFQKAIVDDPPAIFLAWGTRSQAVTDRFSVVPNPHGDLLQTLRLWRPADSRIASRN